MLQMRRSRGAFSGFLLMLLGLWGALIPFVGPYFDYAYTPDKAWTYNTGRLWLELLPGAAVFLGGFLLMIARSRHTALFGALLAAAAGAWFTLGHGAEPAVEPPRPDGRVAGQQHRVHADHGATRLLHRARRRDRVRRGRWRSAGSRRCRPVSVRSRRSRRPPRPRPADTVPADTVRADTVQADGTPSRSTGCPPRRCRPGPGWSPPAKRTEAEETRAVPAQDTTGTVGSGTIQ